MEVGAHGERRVLMVDDVPEFCQQVRAMLRGFCGETQICTSPVRALRRLRAGGFDLLITTLQMRELGGFDVIRRVRGQGDAIPIMLITGHGNEQTGIEATRLGVTDYLQKPVATAELRARIEKIFARSVEAPSPNWEMMDLVTQDPATRAVLDTLPLIARSDSRVLILGETGTGKQLVAQAIHRASGRAAEPFVEVNCAAIPENLLESELFGHERGAFTGATERRIGRFEEAARGTLLLDEIGEMNFGVQSKLLRVLQNGRFNRVGGQQTMQSQARVLAATNRDLAQEVEAGRFRADLYYRLHVISLTMPPLRKRPADIPLLARHFLKRFRRGEEGPAEFSPEVMRALQLYGWPGNVREMEHTVERLAVMSANPVVELMDLPEKLRLGLSMGESARVDFSATLAEARAAFERRYLEEGLQASQGNMAEAARRAGVDKSQYFRLVRRHALDPARFR
ncbi:MAG: sigma-54 dependent transcriptional regulator [Candidatus Didemnitutus sp.]|nr:sigma-54 dependent transcriptional regulator [Candidatus Didemnitutus sp.]